MYAWQQHYDHEHPSSPKLIFFFHQASILKGLMVAKSFNKEISCEKVHALFIGVLYIVHVLKRNPVLCQRYMYCLLLFMFHHTMQKANTPGAIIRKKRLLINLLA